MMSKFTNAVKRQDWNQRVATASLALTFAAAATLLTYTAAYTAALFPIVVTALLGILLAALNRLVTLVCCMVLAGFLQAPLAGLTQMSSILWIDDVLLLGGILAIIHRIFLHQKWQVFIVSLTALFFLLVGVARSPAFEAGVYQARQIVVPIVLILVGSLLQQRELHQITKFVFPLGLITAVYVVIEMTGVHLVDPWYALKFNDLKSIADYAYSRDLPLNYYYFYGNASDLYFNRSGGLFLNPPGVGIFVAGVGLLVQGFGSRRQKLVAPFMTAIVVVSSVGRAAAVVFLLGLGQSTVVKRLTRIGFVLIATVAAALLMTFFSDQGNSAAHASGFLEGVKVALANPMGVGFGRVGNVADQAEESFGESLLGMFVASLGWPALAVVGFVIVVALRNADRIQNIALTAAIMTSALSETLSGLAFVAPLWVLAGNAWSSEIRSPHKRTRPRFARS